MTREEAIKVVRNIYQTDAEKEALETLIPELRESEDERIRKWLYDYFKTIGSASWLHEKDMPYEQILAYLEKQKTPNARQRLAEWSKTEEGKAKYEEVAKEMREEMEKEQNPEDRFAEAREKYQVEWSDEDKKILDDVSHILIGLNYKQVAKDYKQAVEKLLYSRPSWKPSEDEERLINTSISFLKDFADKGYKNAVECIDWLKSKLNGNSGK